MSTAAALLPGIEPVSMSGYHRDFAAFAEQLGASFRRYGFAVIADHGLDQPVIDRAIEATKAFFALPDDVKRRYHQPGGGGARGYTPFGIETAKGGTHVDLKEFWHVGRELPEGHPFRAVMADNVWPEELPAFRERLLGLYDALDAMGGKVLRAIARDLGLADGFFEPTVENGNSVLRLLHYPPVPADAPGVRAGAHEDINTITLLLGAEEAGLEGARPRRALAADQPAARCAGCEYRRHAAAADQPCAALDLAPGGEPGTGAARLFAIFDAFLPALRARLPDRDAAGLHHAGQSEPLSGADQQPRIPYAAPARDQADLTGSPALRPGRKV
jgi:hypothetical protein